MDFKEKDRVQAVGDSSQPGLKKCSGTITQIRKETITNSASTKKVPLLIKVLWDNGTHSYFDPEALKKAP